MDFSVFIAGMGGLMLLNTALGFYIIRLRHKIALLQEALKAEESSGS